MTNNFNFELKFLIFHICHIYLHNWQLGCSDNCPILDFVLQTKGFRFLSLAQYKIK